MRKSNSPCQLYSFEDRDGELLYVGISYNAWERLKEHRRKGWFKEVAHFRVENFRTRREAEKEEAFIIYEFNPLYNKQLRKALLS